MYLSPTGAIERCADIPGGEGEYEVAVGFTCSLRDASILVDVLRSEDRKMGDPPTRVYIYKRPVGWKRLPKDAVLTVIMDAKVHLNPKVFGDSQIPVVSKTPMAVKFGSS